MSLPLLPPDLRGLSPDDVPHMLRAVELARRGWGRVQPNPMVGCVLVLEGAVVGEGWHQEFGGPHAEVHAILEAGERARGATAYVSLEPCGHFGNTPPCTLALLDAGVSRVVFGAADPGENSGGGAEALRAAGVEVVGPCLTPSEAIRENPAFFLGDREGRPLLALKLAQSLDGKIAAMPGARTAVSGAESQARVQWLRSGFDGILVGTNTARIDDPLLTVRGPLQPVRPPARILLDRHARTPLSARIFQDGMSAPVVIFVGEDAPEADIEHLEEAGASVHPVPMTREGLDLERVLSVCWDTGLRSILCEGGGKLATSLLRQELVDRLHLFVSLRTLGPEAVPAFPGVLSGEAWEGWVHAIAPEILGSDVHLVLDRWAEDGVPSPPSQGKG